MDGGNDGDFSVVYDGQGLPGTYTHAVSGLTVGQIYRFKVTAVNFNGEGDASDEASIYACLSPEGFDEPRYVSSTEDSLTVEWDAPARTNGCPIAGYELFTV
jgi:hypothetical protein